MTYDLPTSRKNMSMIAFRFLKKSNKGKSPLRTSVVRISGGSKRKRASTFGVPIVGTPLRWYKFTTYEL